MQDNDNVTVFVSVGVGVAVGVGVDEDNNAHTNDHKHTNGHETLAILGRLWYNESREMLIVPNAEPSEGAGMLPQAKSISLNFKKGYVFLFTQSSYYMSLYHTHPRPNDL